jgi:peptidoglycan/LPS O-acetylase OafA/YrhL
MMRRVAVLRGLAILAVVLYHCAAWGQTAAFYWAHTFRAVQSPNFDQFGAPWYYASVLIERWAWFSVPAFLFASGFSIGYAGGRGTASVSWATVRARTTLVIRPYLLWSVVIFLGDALLLRTRYPWGEYLRRLAVGGAVGPYYFVPLLVQFLILSPFITRWAKRSAGTLLFAAAIVQVTMQIMFHVPGSEWGTWAYPWGFCYWTFFFALGAVAFQHQERAWELTARARWILLLVAACLWVYSTREVVTLFSSGASFEAAHHAQRLSSSIYAVVFMLAFLGFGRGGMPFSGALQWLGARSYGIYLLHFSAQTVVSKLLYHVAPSVFAHQALYQLLLLVTGLGLPLVLMEAVGRSPLRRSCVYLFGVTVRPARPILQSHPSRQA